MLLLSKRSGLGDSMINCCAFNGLVRLDDFSGCRSSVLAKLFPRMMIPLYRYMKESCGGTPVVFLACLWSH